MTEAPERIWAYAGAFRMWREKYPEHVKSPVEYLRADHVDALLKAERDNALREAAGVCERIRTQKTNGPMPERVCFDYEQSILDLIEKDATDGKRTESAWRYPPRQAKTETRAVRSYPRRAL